MPKSSQATSKQEALIPRTPNSLVLLLPTDPHPSLWSDEPFGQWTSHTVQSESGSGNATAYALTSTDFGNNVYVETIARIAAKSYLDEADKQVVRDVFSRAREIYRGSVESIFGDSDTAEWDSKHADAYSKAFRSAMLTLDPHSECKADESCSKGTFAPPGTSCQPTESPIRDLAIVPRVVTAEQLVMIARAPSTEPAYDLHTLKPVGASDSTTIPAVSVQATSSQAPTNSLESQAMFFPAGSRPTASRKRQRSA